MADQSIDVPAPPAGVSTGRRRVLRAAAGVGAASLAGVAASRSGRAVLDQRWAFHTGGPVRTSPTIVDGTVFVGCADSPLQQSGERWPEGTLYALAADDGTERWTFDVGQEVGSAPNVVEGTVFFGGGLDTFVHAVDAEDGTERWTFDTGHLVSSSPTVVDGTVFIGSSDRHVYALDAEDGTERWAYETFQPVVSSPTVVGGTVFVGSTDDRVYALDAEDGTERWRFNAEGPIHSSPTVVDGTVFIGSYYGLHALDAGDGTERWRFENPRGSVWATPTVFDGTVFLASDEGRTVYAIDAQGGSKVWEFEAGSRVRSSPTVADGTVFVGGEALYALRAADGEKRGEFEADRSNSSSPTVVDGTVFFGDYDGVYALDADVDGRSEGSRVTLGTLGHHGAWTGAMPPGDFSFDESNDDAGDDTGTPTDSDDGQSADGADNTSRDGNGGAEALGPGLGIGAAITGIAGAGYLLGRRRGAGDSDGR